MPKTILLGGTFNPLHIMHIRMAVEVMEAFLPEDFFFVPAATPPHKVDAGLLSFADRCIMLEAALASFPFFSVSRIEEKRIGPSYTVDTLRLLYTKKPESRLGVILGSEDIHSLPLWHEWQELSVYADFILPARGSANALEVADAVEALWPGALCYLMKGDFYSIKEALPFETAWERISKNRLSKNYDKVAMYLLPDGGKVFFLPIPRMDISSSLVRDRWLRGKCIRYLVPDSTSKYLDRHSDAVRAVWKK